MNQPDIIIAGAGWAGLAAAVELSRNNIPVTLVESSKNIGGRARRVEFDDLRLDNGQHLMIGAYSHLLGLLNLIGVDEAQVFHRLPQHLEMRDIDNPESRFQLSLPRLPAPLHLLLGILSTASLKLKDKLSILFKFNRLLRTPLHQDISVNQWLGSAALPEAYVEKILKPLCLAALTTHTDQASAKLFQAVLQQTFSGASANTDLLIPKTDLGQLFPDAARLFIESRGGRVLTEHKLERILVKDGRVRSVLINQTEWTCDELILATPAHLTAKLMDSSAACSSIVDDLEQLDFEPVTTVYLQYSTEVKLDQAMLGLLNGLGEWIFDRRYCGQAGLMAVVISAQGPHMTLKTAELANRISSELARLFPHWPNPEKHWVIREKRACFRCRVDVDELRPGIDTPVSNLKLCGDFVKIEPSSQAGLPSTLEAALRSGVECARRLIQKLS